LADNRRHDEARAALGRAIELGEAETPRPAWLWDAHRVLAQVIGPELAAASHWQEFLKLAPIDSPYRVEAKRILAQLGQSPTSP
jgi:hypothetical protein